MPNILHPVFFDATSANPYAANLHVTGGPRFSTIIEENGGGDDTSQTDWAQALWEWELQFVRDAKLLGDLMGFFLARFGRGYCFAFIDPNDYNDSDQGGSGVVFQDTDSNWYLGKTYPDAIYLAAQGGSGDQYAPYTRKIRCPVKSTIVLGGGAVGGTVNPWTGEVTGISAVGTWTGQFGTPARLDVDWFNPESNAATGDWESVKIKEQLVYSVA